MGNHWLIIVVAFLSLTGASGAQEPRKKALVIGIDGCRPDALLAAKAPRLQGLIAAGSFSDQAQTGDFTSSGPGWSSFLTGVWREKHGVRENGFQNANFKDYPHLLDRFKKARPDGFAASVVHWAPIQQKIITRADHTSAHKTDADTLKKALELVPEKKLDLLFVHFDDVDGAGHKHGFHPKNEKYLEGISVVDGQVGQLLDAVKARPTHAQEDWLVVVSTDHGGSGKSHGRNEPEHRTIFFIVSGPSAQKGKIDPAPGIVDVTPTVLRHLGVEIDPAWKLDGKAVGVK